MSEPNILEERHEPNEPGTFSSRRKSSRTRSKSNTVTKCGKTKLYGDHEAIIGEGIGYWYFSVALYVFFVAVFVYNDIYRQWKNKKTDQTLEDCFNSWKDKGIKVKYHLPIDLKRKKSRRFATKDDRPVTTPQDEIW